VEDLQKSKKSLQENNKVNLEALNNLFQDSYGGE